MSEKRGLLKICSICGQQKPLSAFLQLAGTRGGSYGNVCATCRSAGLDKPIAKEVEDHSQTTSGLEIDAKTVLQRKKDLQIEHNEIEENYHEERDLKEEKQSRLIEQTLIRSKAEEKGRDRIKKSFLDEKKAAKPTGNAPDSVGEVLSKEQNVNLVHFIDTYISGKEKFKGSAIRTLFTLLNKEEVIGMNKPKPIDAKENKKTLTEEIKENWVPPENKGPSGGRR